MRTKIGRALDMPCSDVLPVAFATWQMGVWISAPCVTAVQYHGTALTAVGTSITVVAAGILAWGSGCPCTVDLD